MKKPGTAGVTAQSTARPAGRSQTRGAGKSTGRKNSRTICEGNAYLGPVSTTNSSKLLYTRECRLTAAYMRSLQKTS